MSTHWYMYSTKQCRYANLCSMLKIVIWVYSDSADWCTSNVDIFPNMSICLLTHCGQCNAFICDCHIREKFGYLYIL